MLCLQFVQSPPRVRGLHRADLHQRRSQRLSPSRRSRPATESFSYSNCPLGFARRSKPAAPWYSAGDSMKRSQTPSHAFAHAGPASHPRRFPRPLPGRTRSPGGTGCETPLHFAFVPLLVYRLNRPATVAGRAACRRSSACRSPRPPAVSGSRAADVTPVLTARPASPGASACLRRRPVPARRRRQQERTNGPILAVFLGPDRPRY